MRLELDLGLPSLAVLVACAVVPLICLVLRSKWRRSAARKEEIRRLMILASEEAARAELESSGCGYVPGYSYSYEYADGYANGHVALPAAQSNHCAVCYSTTTTRCAQCKAVRYCSGKCQIIHWRQGHKDECHPPATKSDFEHKASSTFEYKNGVQYEPAVLSHDESKFVASTEASRVKQRNVVVDFNAESSSESSGSQFSGFTASSAGSDSSDDASISESISSNDSGSSDEHLSDDSAHGLSRTSSSAEDLDQAKRISPKFASLVDSNDGSPGSNKLNQRSLASYAGQAPGKLTRSLSSSNGGVQDDLVAKASTNSHHLHHTSVPLNPKGKRSNNLSDSSVDCSRNSSGSNITGLGSLHDSVPNKKDDDETTSRFGSTAHLDLLEPVEAGFSISSLASVTSGSTKDASSIESVRNPTADASRSDRHLDSVVGSRKGGKVNATFVAVKAEDATLSPNSGSKPKAFAGPGVEQMRGSAVSRQYSVRGVSDIAGRYSDKGLFPYELFVKLYTWKEVELRPCGLMNCGNSCYANAVLQCLAFTPPLTAYFLQGLHSKICAKEDWCFMCQFESLILKAKEGKSPVSPSEIVDRLESIGSQLSNGREEDAHEFLRYAIDAMESICLAETRISSGSSEDDTTLIGLTFGGYLRSKIRCTKCQGKSERWERMMDLTVEIEGDIATLEEALRRFTVSETLDGENKYQCSRCGSYEKARKKLTILEAPNVLTIALKRFQLGKFGKLNKPINYPEILDLAPYMSGTNDMSPIYRLYGVIVHLDVKNASDSGHYICYVKNPQNKWFKINDSTVTPVDHKTVLEVGAYMLLYSRCSPRAPRSLRNQIISDPKPKPVPSRIITKIPTLNLKHRGNPLYDDLHPELVKSEGMARMESFYSGFRRLRTMPEEDSPSDSSSLFSNNSDEGSSSSDGTRDSNSTTDEFSEYLFGGLRSPFRSSTDSDSTSTSMPLSSSSSPVADSEKQAPGFPATSGPKMDSGLNKSFLHRNGGGGGGGGGSGSNRSSSIRCSSYRREPDSERL